MIRSRVLLALCILVLPAAAATAQPASGMTVPEAALLGAVEGVTEFLPISSTGHLLVTQRLLGMQQTPAEKEAADSYAVVIQLGAILAVLAVSLRRVGGMLKGLVGRDRDGLKLAGQVVLAALPAAASGLLLEDRLKQYLFHPWPIAAALAAGGIFILVFLRRKGDEGGTKLEGMTWWTALAVGLAQMLALWPGVSRSLVTMAAGVLAGLTVSAAVEFSFLLGLVTLGGATLYELVRYGDRILSLFGWISPLVGLVVSAATGFLAVRWMVGYLKTRSLAAFGWYRLALGVLIAVLVLAGVM